MAKTAAMVFGVIFVLVGLLGFVSNPLDGANGLFVTNGLYNLVYIVFGVILVIASRSGQARAAAWLKILGVVYLIVAILGFLLSPNGPTLLGLLSTNAMDNWLNVVLGIVLLLCGIRGNMAASQPAMPMGGM